MQITPTLLRALIAVLSSGAAASAQSMYIETCSLGCSSGSSGPVTCGTLAVPADAEIAIRFSRPVDFASVSHLSIQFVNVADGTVPSLFAFLDPLDARRVIYRANFLLDPSGGILYSLVPGATYQVRVSGQMQGDPPPYVTSSDMPGLPNQSAMNCSVQILPPAYQGLAPYCFGTSPACPCGNAGDPDRGCANSVVPQGARLAAQGSARLTLDTVVLYAFGMPNSTCLFFQGTARTNGGAGTAFGDGLRCADGTVTRLAAHAIFSGGQMVYPYGGDPSTSIAGGVAMPGTRTYQTWYRNAASFCTAATFNTTNGVEITWQP